MFKWTRGNETRNSNDFFINRKKKKPHSSVIVKQEAYLVIQGFQVWGFFFFLRFFILHIPIVKECPVKSFNCDLWSIQKNENNNPMIIYVIFDSIYFWNLRILLLNFPYGPILYSCLVVATILDFQSQKKTNCLDGYTCIRNIPTKELFHYTCSYGEEFKKKKLSQSESIIGLSSHFECLKEKKIKLNVENYPSNI